MIKLRDYQKKVIADIKEKFNLGKRSIILQLPTGAGKTIIFTEIAKQAKERGSNVLVVTDRVELLTQAGGAFDEFGITPKYLTQNTKVLSDHSIWVGMVETIKRRLKNKDYYNFVQSFSLIIIDEAHKQTFNRLFEAITPWQYVIGATATPYRIGKMKELKYFYDEIVMGEQIPGLIKSEYLSPAIHYGVPIEGLNNIKLTKGEFDNTEVGKLYDKPTLFDGVVNNYTKHCPNKKALVFSANINNSKNLCKEFKMSGITAIHLDSETPKHERAQILSDFNKGIYKVLCNVGILTTGYDDPTIEVIIVYRPTMSLPLWLQMCGRGSRKNEGKNNFIILDFGENTKRHGFWDAERVWSLENDKKPKKKGVQLIKECPECEALVNANVSECEYCGYIFTKEKKEKSPIEVVLEQLTPTEINRRDWNFYELEEVRKAKNYKVGWVLRRLKTYKDFEDYARLKGYKKGWIFYNAKMYLKR